MANIIRLKIWFDQLDSLDKVPLLAVAGMVGFLVFLFVCMSIAIILAAYLSRCPTEGVVV